MQLFYASTVTDNVLILDEKESAHCTRVLRMKKGAIVRATDGRGNLFEGILYKADPVRCEIKVTNIIHDYEKRNYRLHIAISPLKNPERFDWFVEKCVEIGIDEITPVICRHTEKQSIKHERIRNIILSAMKQSVKTFKTELNPACSFDQFISEESQDKKMIAHCSRITGREKISDTYTRGENVRIIIGPEGDFSEEEITVASGKGFIPVHLGTSRLRSETAGIAACHTFYMLNL
jgi:16S rRNA (uracil1498-N3)-methyltransferase